MPKKSTASKPLPPNYIAIDNNHEDIIAIGTKEQIVEAIQEYCYDSGWDENDVEDLVNVYELGKEINLVTDKQIKIDFDL
jgi:hypothetical protein